MCGYVYCMKTVYIVYDKKCVYAYIHIYVLAHAHTHMYMSPFGEPFNELL